VGGPSGPKETVGGPSGPKETVGGPLGPKSTVLQDASNRRRGNTEVVRVHSPKSRTLRKGRYSETGRIYFITSSCEHRFRLFLSPELAYLLIDESKTQEKLGGCRSLAFEVMPDHFHWLVQLTAARTLQELVGSLKGRSARRINMIRGVSGRVWQPGFHDHAIRRETAVENLANYLLLNPVREGLVERFEEYPYSYSIWHDRG